MAEQTQAQAAISASATGLNGDGTGTAGSGIMGYGAAIDAVFQELSLGARLRGRRLQVELADPLVHLDVMEGEFAGASERQLRAVALACAAEVLPEGGSEHALRYQLQRGGRQLLLCAVRQSLIDAIAAAAATHGSSLRSIECDFIREWNQHGRRLRRSGLLFAVSPGCDAAVAWVDRGVITALSSGSLASPDAPPAAEPGSASWAWRSTAAALLDRQADRLLAGLGQERDAAHGFVLVAGQPAATSCSPRWTVVAPTGSVR